MATNPPEITGLDILERLVRRAGFDEVEERSFLEVIANERDPAKANATAEVRAAEAAFDAAVQTRDTAKITQAAQNLDKAKANAAAAASGDSAPSNVVPLTQPAQAPQQSATSTIKAAAVAQATANYNAALAETPPDPSKVAATAEALETAQGLPD